MPTTNLKDTTDYNALDSAVTAQDIAAYRAAGGKNLGSAWIALMVILAFMSAIFFIWFISTFFGALFDGGISVYDAKDMITPIIVSLVFALPIFPVYFLNKSAGRRAMVQTIRFNRFAVANGWAYSEWPKKQFPLDGVIFNAGHEQHTYNVLRSTGGVDFMYGTHRFVTGIGRGRSTNEFGFIALTTTQNLPHIVLDAKANNGRVFNKELFTNLPKAFDKDQEISISPEVDALYRAYAATNDVAAIAQILTPDFITKLKQLSGSYDIEISGDKVYLYSPYPFKKSKEAVAEVLGLIDLLAEAFSVPVSIQPKTAPSLETHITGTPVLKGGTPTFVKVLGVSAVIIQFIALIGLLVGQNQ